MNVLTVDYRASSAPVDFAKSLRETGFAVVTNHPVRFDLIMETYRDWERFFASEEKHAHTFDPKLQSGYFPFRTENAKDSEVKDLKEFFHLYPGTKMPEMLGKATLALNVELTRLATELLGWIDAQTEAHVRAKFSIPLSEMIKESDQILFRILHYPPLTGAEEAGAIRAAAHEDINLITLLPSATAPGLQVRDAQGNWIDIQCDPGSIVVNAGDMLQEASGGYYRSTTHQVINPPGPSAQSSRYSMPLFLHPRSDVRLSDQHTARSYLHQRLKEIGLLK